MYTIEELAELLRLSYRGVLKLIKENRIHAVKIGREWRILKDEYDRIMREGA